MFRGRYRGERRIENGAVTGIGERMNTTGVSPDSEEEGNYWINAVNVRGEYFQGLQLENINFLFFKNNVRLFSFHYIYCKIVSIYIL